MGLFKKRNSFTPKLNPSDALIAFSGLDGEDLHLFQNLILDYQGGGIATPREAVLCLQARPTEDQQREMGEIGSSMIECIKASDGSTAGQIFALAMMGNELGHLLNKTDHGNLPIHSAITTATVNAMVTLLRKGMELDALYVTLLGQCLYMNADTWSAARKST